MTREIKFRVISKGDKPEDYLYTTLYPLDDKCYSSTSIIHKGDIVNLWTGLKDKHGVEIYEGDVIFQDSGGYRTTGIVNLSSDLRWCVGSHYIPCDPLYDKYREIKGNIYENPELLEK